MKVFITSSTGMLGKRLVDELGNRGNEPVGLVRDNDGAELVEQQGGTPVYGDLFDVESLMDAAGDADTVVLSESKSGRQRCRQPAGSTPTSS